MKDIVFKAKIVEVSRHFGPKALSPVGESASILLAVPMEDLAPILDLLETMMSSDKPVTVRLWPPWRTHDG